MRPSTNWRPIGRTSRLAALVLIAGPALVAPAAADDSKICVNGFGAPKIAACTRAIQSGRWRGRDLAWAYVDRGNGYQNVGDHDQAIADYDTALRLEPKEGNAYIGRGGAWRDKHEGDRALADFDEAVRLEPKSSIAFSNRGNVYQDRGDADHALADYDAAIRLDPNNADAYIGRGNVYHDDKRDNDRALDAYEQAIRLDPNSAWAHNGRGNAYSDKGDKDRALADYDEAIRLDPKNAYPHNGRANIYRARGDVARAEADYDESIRLDPTYELAYRNRATMFFHDGDPERAVADFEAAIRLRPKSANTYFLAGIANFNRANFPAAVADFEQGGALDPKSAYIALWLDIAAQRVGRPSVLSLAVPRLDMTNWPAPIVLTYLGQTPEPTLLDTARDLDRDKDPKGEVCEANFYGGEYVLRQGARDEALRLFELAARDCPKGFVETPAAVAAAAALRAPAPGAAASSPGATGRLELALVAEAPEKAAGAPLRDFTRPDLAIPIERDLTLPGDIESIAAIVDAQQRPALEAALAPAVVDRLRSGGDLAGRRVALVLDGRTVLAVATVQAGLAARMQFSGAFTQADLERLTAAIAPPAH
ncbi:MAG: tetratricopeptide repeat protein [Roseiarcus sp.]|jgi:tetratricopeptide (TPR) repeat protein